MSSITGIYWYVLTASGPACITAIHNDYYTLTDLQHKHTPMNPTFLSPIYRSLTDFRLAYPEYFV